MSSFTVQTGDLLTASGKFQDIATGLNAANLQAVIDNIASAMRGGQTASTAPGAASAAGAAIKALASSASGIAETLRESGVAYEHADAVATIGK